MSHPIPLLQWQTITLTCLLGVAVGLFIALFVLLFVAAVKKKLTDKWHMRGLWVIFGVFVVAIVLGIVGVSFWVDAELGWKFAVIAGVFACLCVLSFIVPLVKCEEMSKAAHLFWTFLALFSIAVVLTLVTAKIGKSKHQNKHRQVESKGD